MLSTVGSTSSENSPSRQSDCPDDSTRSISRTAWVSQITPASTRQNSAKAAIIWRRMYRSSRRMGRSGVRVASVMTGPGGSGQWAGKRLDMGETPAEPSTMTEVAQFTTATTDIEAPATATGSVAILLAPDGAMDKAGRRVNRLTRGAIERLAASESWEKMAQGDAVLLSFPAGMAASRLIVAKLGRRPDVM